MSGLVGRLAPSPTGAQHLGNARTYLLAWLSIRSRGGALVLRIEDIDSPRIKVGAAQQAVDDLRWLGLDWDEGPDRPGTRGPYVQTERIETYKAALEQLKAAEAVYPCVCTRSDIEAAASAPHVGQEGPIYPGTCASKRVADAAQLSERPFAWRFRTPDETVVVNDLVCGNVPFDMARELGDFVVYKSDATPAYQLAVVVDDHAMGVTEVLRGDDLLPSAARQMVLYRFFGWSAPAFAHVSLVTGTDGRRLAKRHGDTRLAWFREQGVRSERLVGYLAWTAGLIDRQCEVAPSELLAGFSLSSIPRQPVVFDEKAFAWLLQQ
jgi:glutamyl-tRNA synthetase